MRDTIDFGIDLGTTNSAIAVAQNGAVEVIKNDDGWDYTPSAVWLRRPGTVHVGRRARAASEKFPEDVAFEFKLQMGLADARFPFDKAGVDLTPPELSAEVLKSLRADVVRRFESDPPEAAVITVPAAFAMHQTSATNDAARLAGFGSPCPLLQEPTAAAFAYGSQDATERAYWMVFDLGGGTFDAAVMSKRDGEMQVLNHHGDTDLGGKLIDWAIVDRLLAPAVSRELGFAGFRRDNPAWRVNFVKLKLAAEDAKIQLSARDTAEILVDNLDDGHGGEEEFEYTLTRAELDGLAEPFYVRALACCREALREGGLRPDDIDRLLLVGGATQAPGLRELLADPQRGLGIALDFSQDPTTVVARGAALFARTVRLERPLAAPKPGEFTAELIYDPTVITTTPMVAGRLYSATPVGWSGYSVRVRGTGPEPFDSGMIGLSNEGTFATEVVVPEGETGRFTVELTDSAGRPQRLTPNTLTITHSDTEFGGAKLTESLGIGTADNTFVPMLRKGTSLPTRHRMTYQTSAALRRDNAASVIRIPVVEGARPRTNRNLQVGVLEIRARDVRMDLPAGTEVEVTFEIDSSRLVTVVADVPLVRVQVEAEIDLNDKRTPDQDELTDELREVEQRVARLRADAADEPDTQQRLAVVDLSDVQDKVRTSRVDRADAVAAERKLRDHQAELDEVEDALRMPELLSDLQQGLDECAQEVEQSGRPEDRQELAELRRRADEVARDRDVVAAEKLLRRTFRFQVELLRRRADWPVIWFDALRRHRDHMHPSAQADRLIQEGERAIAIGDYRELSAVCEQLRRLVPPNTPDPVIYLGTPGR